MHNGRQGCQNMDRDFQVDRMAIHVTEKSYKTTDLSLNIHSTIARQTRIHMHTIRAEQTRSPSLAEDTKIGETLQQLIS